MPRELNCIGADPASDFEHLATPPALELGEPRNMGLHEVLPRRDLLEILQAADRLGGMPDVARAAVPVVPHGCDRDRLEWRGHETSRARMQDEQPQGIRIAERAPG